MDTLPDTCTCKHKHTYIQYVQSHAHVCILHMYTITCITDGHTDKYTDRQADKENRQTDGQTSLIQTALVPQHDMMGAL